MGPLISLFWDFCRRLLLVSYQGGFHHLHALSTACNGFLRFTSGVTPADYLAASMASEQLSNILAYIFDI